MWHFLRTTANRLLGERNGNVLLETALLLPFLIIVGVNTLSLGSMFRVYLNLTAAPAHAVSYSVVGTSTVLGTSVPGADLVSSLLYDNVNATLPSASNSPTEVCSIALGLSGSGATQVPNCTTYGDTSNTNFAAPQPDPEAPYLILHKVDIQYTATPLLQGSIFNLLSGPRILHRSVMMRAMP